MRQLRSFKTEVPCPIEAVKERAVQFISRYFTEDEKSLIRSYIDADPVNWWTRFDRDHGRVLGNALGGAGYGEMFLGEHQLSDLYLGIIEKAVRR